MAISKTPRPSSFWPLAMAAAIRNNLTNAEHAVPENERWSYQIESTKKRPNFALIKVYNASLEFIGYWSPNV